MFKASGRSPWPPNKGTGGSIDGNKESEPARGVGFVDAV